MGLELGIDLHLQIDLLLLLLSGLWRDKNNDIFNEIILNASNFYKSVFYMLLMQNSNLSKEIIKNNNFLLSEINNTKNILIIDLDQ